MLEARHEHKYNMKGSIPGGESFYTFFFLIYFWLHWVFGAVRELSLVVVSGATLHCSAWASHCSGFSSRSMGSRHTGFSSCGSWALDRMLSSCGTWA